MNGSLTNGTYKTPNGSTVTISGKHLGRYAIEFDWLEEGACFEAIPYIDFDGGRLAWSCDCCPNDSSSAALIPEKSSVASSSAGVTSGEVPSDNDVS